MAAIWLATYGWSRYEFYTHKANAAVRKEWLEV